MSVIPYAFMGLMVLTGSLNTIFLSLQFSQYSLNLPYRHAWFQSQNMFLGELYCLIFYYIVKFNETNETDVITDEKKENEEENPPSIFLLAIPAACDLIASTLLAFALLNMATSVYQMLRGGLVLVTATLSVIFLNKNQYRHHILGLLIVFLSIFLIGFAGVIYKKETDVRSTNIGGICMMLLSLLFTGVQFIVEELLLNKYTINPLKVVGLEGMWGSIFYTVILIVLQQIHCDNFFGKVDVCSLNNYNEWRVEDTLFSLRQMINNKALFALVVAATFSIAFYNFFGVSVTKHASSAQRAVVDNLRTIVIWIFFLIVPSTIKEQFIWLQLIGFIGLVLGTLIYNEVLEIPYCNLNKYTKNNMIKEEEELKNTENGNYGAIEIE